MAGRRAGWMRSAALLLGGVAGFLGIVEAAFDGVVDSVTGGVSPDDARLFALAVTGLVGAVFARRRPGFCAGLELVAGVGLLAGATTSSSARCCSRGRHLPRPASGSRRPSRARDRVDFAQSLRPRSPRLLLPDLVWWPD